MGTLRALAATGFVLIGWLTVDAVLEQGGWNIGHPAPAATHAPAPQFPDINSMLPKRPAVQ